MFIFIYLFLATIILNKAVYSISVYKINEQIGNLMYGDIVLSPKQIRLQKYKNKNGNINQQIAIKKILNNRWKNNIVPFVISNKYLNFEKKKLLDAFKTLEAISCFRFFLQTTEKDYLFVDKIDGCFSYVGRIGGKQLLSLADGCLYDYIIWHEVMHALGLEHEHQRPDRDHFIKIQYENVDPEKLANFELIPVSNVNLYHDYDYASIMHYDKTAFGRLDPFTNKILVTMVPLKKGVELNENLVLSETDVEKLNILGKCEKNKFVFKNESNRFVDKPIWDLFKKFTI